jgi:hypothetical protein
MEPEWLRAYAALLQAIGVGSSLGWGAFLYWRETKNKRVERTRALLETFFEDDFREKRSEFKSILEQNKKHIADIAAGEGGEWKGKRAKVQHILNLYEVNLMMAERGYFDKGLMLEVFGDAMRVDFHSAREYTEAERKIAQNKIEDPDKLYEFLQRVADGDPQQGALSKSIGYIKGYYSICALRAKGIWARVTKR